MLVNISEKDINKGSYDLSKISAGDDTSLFLRGTSLLTGFIGKFPCVDKICLSGLTGVHNLNLSNFSEGIKSLSIELEGVQEFRGTLPESIENLRFTLCNTLTELNFRIFPSKLKEVTVSYFAIKKFKGKLPDGLKKVSFNNCNYLEELDLGIIPQSVTEVNLLGSNTKLYGKFPEGLETLAISYLDDNTLTLDGLPDSLKNLFIKSNSSEETIYFKGDFPKLKRLYLSNVKTVLDVSKLPGSLEKIELYNSVVDLKGYFNSDLSSSSQGVLRRHYHEICAGLPAIDLSMLPKNITNLDLSKSNFTGYKGEFPPSLKTIKVGENYKSQPIMRELFEAFGQFLNNKEPNTNNVQVKSSGALSQTPSLTFIK